MLARRRWVTRPNAGAFAIDLSHPLASGFADPNAALYLLNDPGNLGLDLANGHAAVIGGVPTAIDQPIGIAARFTVATTDQIDTGLKNVGMSRGTVTWCQQPVAAFNAGTVRAVWGISVGLAAPEFSCQIFSDNNWYVGWNQFAGVDNRVTLAATASNWDTTKESWYSLTWGVGGNTILYKDGAVLSTYVGATAVGNYSSPGDTMRVGRQGGLPNYAESFLAWWSIQAELLEPAEIEAFHANAYQILRPRSRHFHVVPSIVASSVAYAYPTSDGAAGAWLPSTGSALAPMVADSDSGTPDDATFIYVLASGSTAKLALEPAGDDGTDAGRKWRFRARSPQSRLCAGDIYGNGVFIRTETFPLTPTLQTFLVELTAAESALIRSSSGYPLLEVWLTGLAS